MEGQMDISSLYVGKTPEEVVNFAIALAEVFESKTQYSYAEGMVSMAKLVNAFPEDVCKKMDEKLLSIRDKCFGGASNEQKTVKKAEEDGSSQTSGEDAQV